MMAIPKDIDSLRLVSLAPDRWAQWVANLDDARVRDFIEVPGRPTESDRDILIQVKSYRQGELLILNRWQLYYDENIAYRISTDAAMAREKYRLSVYPVLINILPPSPRILIGNSFYSNCLGLEARQDCRTINLWDVDVEMAFLESLTPLMPFVPIMKRGNDERVLRRAAIVLEAEKEFDDLQRLLAIFATYVFGVDVADRIMNLQTDAFRASPLAAFLKEEGRQEGNLQMLMMLIECRFGEVPKCLKVILPSLSAEELQEVGKRFLQANALNEFLASIYQAMNKDC